MKEKESDQLKKIAPRLAQLRDQLPTPKPPEGYLDDMTASLMDKIKQEPATGRRVPFRRSSNRYWLGVAASLLLLVAVGWWLTAEQEMTTTALTWDDIPTETVQAYVLENIEDFELDLLLNEQFDPLPSYNLDPTSIESYLEEDIDLEELEEMGELF